VANATTGGRALHLQARRRRSIRAASPFPHRSALVAETSAFALRPEQVMNRAARGLLGALRALGLDPVYRGTRDCVHRRRSRDPRT
jgi:hypothetical protein